MNGFAQLLEAVHTPLPGFSSREGWWQQAVHPPLDLSLGTFWRRCIREQNKEFPDCRQTISIHGFTRIHETDSIQAAGNSFERSAH
jgi:hypothetical protein